VPLYIARLTTNYKQAVAGGVQPFNQNRGNRARDTAIVPLSFGRKTVENKKIILPCDCPDIAVVMGSAPGCERVMRAYGLSDDPGHP